MTRTLLRPTAFIDSPFGHDRKVARLAGGMTWFAAVELIATDGHRRTSTELVPVEGIESRFDDDMAAQWDALIASRPPLHIGDRTIRLDQPQVMGIVNATPDSFSDGGQFPDGVAAAEAGAGMAADGAAIVDVGGESTRPGARSIWEGDEIDRVAPVIRQLAAAGTAVSCDTRKADVMTAAVEAGARMINDVSALTYDARSAGVAASLNVPVVLMHHRGAPEVMQDDPRYDDVLVEVYLWIEERIGKEMDDLMGSMAAFHEEMAKAGVLLDASGLKPSSKGWRVRYDGKKRTVIDGPFAEAKEILGGFNLIEAADMDEAVRIASEFPWAQVGRIEVREVRDLEAERRRVGA